MKVRYDDLGIHTVTFGKPLEEVAELRRVLRVRGFASEVADRAYDSCVIDFYDSRVSSVIETVAKNQGDFKDGFGSIGPATEWVLDLIDDETIDSFLRLGSRKKFEAELLAILRADCPEWKR